MISLTERQRTLYSFIAETVRETGSAPSYDEMLAHTGARSRRLIYDRITSLIERGYLRRTIYKARGIQLVAPGRRVFIPVTAASAQP